MLQITFLPYSDEKDYSSAVKEYQDIWDTDGNKITVALESNFGLKFRESRMNALVWSGISHAPPLFLRDYLEPEVKKAVLIHELGHCIITGKVVVDKDFNSHKCLFLILYEVYVDIYGKDFADKAVAWDKNLPRDEYKLAWEFALALSKEERRERFKKILKK